MSENGFYFFFAHSTDIKCFAVKRHQKRLSVLQFSGITFRLFKQLVENMFKSFSFFVVVGRLFHSFIFPQTQNFRSLFENILNGTVAYSFCYLLITSTATVILAFGFSFVATLNNAELSRWKTKAEKKRLANL